MTDNINELTLDAVTDNLDTVLEFIESKISVFDVTPKVHAQINIAVEEVFVNIAYYAYKPQTGKVTITVVIENESQSVSITFTDEGIPYNPLEKENSDITSISDDESEIGGLGILIVKKFMDNIIYECRNGRNILTLKKYIR